jgi:hypothetical protein
MGALANEPAPRRGNSSASLLLKPPHKGPQTALSAKLLALTGPKPRLGRGLGQVGWVPLVKPVLVSLVSVVTWEGARAE